MIIKTLAVYACLATVTATYAEYVERCTWCNAKKSGRTCCGNYNPRNFYENCYKVVKVTDEELKYMNAIAKWQAGRCGNGLCDEKPNKHRPGECWKHKSYDWKLPRSIHFLDDKFTAKDIFKKAWNYLPKHLFPKHPRCRGSSAEHCDRGKIHGVWGRSWDCTKCNGYGRLRKTKRYWIGSEDMKRAEYMLTQCISKARGTKTRTGGRFRGRNYSTEPHTKPSPDPYVRRRRRLRHHPAFLKLSDEIRTAGAEQL